jgi:hypothetical protein
MVNRARILKHVRKHVLVGQDGSTCKVITLMHLEGEGRSKPVSAWDVKGSDINFDSLVNEIIDAATADAEGIGDTQKYMLGFYFDNQVPGSTSYGARLPFTVSVAPVFDAGDAEAGIVSSDTIGNSKMQAATAMKFAVDLFRHVIPWSNQIMAQQQQMIQRMEAQANEHHEQQRKLMVLNEKLLSRHHRRQLETRKLIKHEQRKDEMVQMIMPLIPVVVTALAGKPGAAPSLPGPAAEATYTFDQFVRSIAQNPEQLASLQSKLKPMQIPSIMQIVAAVQGGQTINQSVLIEFLKTVDEAQMRAWEADLNEDQIKMLRSSIESAMKKYEDDKDKVRQAYNEITSGEDDEEEEDIIDDEEGLV